MQRPVGFQNQGASPRYCTKGSNIQAHHQHLSSGSKCHEHFSLASMFYLLGSKTSNQLYKKHVYCCCWVDEDVVVSLRRSRSYPFCFFSASGRLSLDPIYLCSKLTCRRLLEHHYSGLYSHNLVSR